uniref:Ig-like domain-containing protein n=1 Tax=Eptatretus burgeri TaxID=7764 RepID=A0A8C4QR96_EPTBU
MIFLIYPALLIMISGSVIIVRPQILNFGRSFVNSGTSWRLFCEAKAKPRPNITWWNPRGLLLNESQVLIEQDDPNKVQIIISTLNITNNEREWRYWCLAQNKHGTAHQRIDFCKKPVHGVSWPIVAWSTSLCLVLLVLAVGLSLYIKNWKRNEGTQDHTVIKNSQESDQSDENMYTAMPNTFSISDDELYENI